MNKALTIPAQGGERLEAIRAAVTRVDGLLALWTTDFRQMPGEALTRLRDAGAVAIKSGDEKALAVVMEMRASQHDVATAMFELIGSFPQYKDEDIAIFSKNLAVDVMDAEPSLPAVLAACKHLRQTGTKRPLIGEVLEALKEKEAAFEQRAALLGRLADRVALATEILEGRDRA